MKQLIIDFDGTLYDTRKAMILSFQKTFKQHHQTVPTIDEIIHAFQDGSSLQTMLSFFLPSAQKSDIEIMSQTYLNIHPNDLISLGGFYPGTPETLEILKEQGHSLIIASNRHQKTLDAIIDHKKIRYLFDAVIGSQLGQPLKPQIDEYNTKLSSDLQHRDSKIVIGDTMTDYYFAKNLDAVFFWIESGYGELSHTASKPSVSVPFFKDILAHL